MRHLDLFSGIGGFALAARWAGIETIAFCEIDSFCQKVLAKNFPAIPINGDIREFRGINCDILTAGFPCQPFSVAGKQRGLATTSLELYAQRICDCVPSMSSRYTHEGRNMGERIEKDKALRSMWERFYAFPYEEAQDLQRELLEYLGEIERKQKMASRQGLDRNKSLGNAIVPQIPFVFMSIIKAISPTCTASHNEK